MIILLLLVICIFGVSLFAENTMYHPTVYDEQHEFDVLPGWGHDVKPFYDSVQREKFSVTVPNGYSLNCEYVAADPELSSDKKKIVILVHGRTANHITMYSHGEAYYKLGFSLVIYDQRGHGISGGKGCSMGYHETQDLVFLAGELKKRFPDANVWGIHGESMGAATVMLAAPSIPWLSFAVEDAGYASLRQELYDSVKLQAKLPKIPFGLCAALISDIREDFKLKDVMPINGVKNTHCPMLFVHGALDKVVPTENVYKLFEAKPGTNKMIKVFDDVPHAKSALMHNEEYKDMLKSFLDEYGLL